MWLLYGKIRYFTSFSYLVLSSNIKLSPDGVLWLVSCKLHALITGILRYWKKLYTDYFVLREWFHQSFYELWILVPGSFVVESLSADFIAPWQFRPVTERLIVWQISLRRFCSNCFLLFDWWKFVVFFLADSERPFLDFCDIFSQGLTVVLFIWYVYGKVLQQLFLHCFINIGIIFAYGTTAQTHVRIF